VDQLIVKEERIREGLHTDELPENIPDLMINSIKILNRHLSSDASLMRTVIVAAKALAWACIKKTLSPRLAKRKNALRSLRRKEVTDELRSLDIPSSYMDMSSRNS